MEKLRRSITLPLLVFYGLGTMVGGGFYALIGKVSGAAGIHAPLAFLLSGFLALLSASSFAELASRFPVSAGEVRYVQAGFGSNSFATFVGCLVIFTGIISAATLSVATVGFAQFFLDLPEILGITSTVILMCIIASLSVGKSVAAVVVITLIEVAALLYIAYIGTGVLFSPTLPWFDVFLPSGTAAWAGISGGAFLAFYSFVGFEDMVNMAEEVKDPERTLPRAIGISLLLTVILYTLVSCVAIQTLPVDRLVSEHTPLATLAGATSKSAGVALALVSLLTGVNGALVQIIMASRVTYGMTKNSFSFNWLARINAKTQTPLVATALISAIILLLALFLPLVSLAKITSAIILLVFTLVNLSLWRIKLRDPDLEGEGPRFPTWLPLVGFAASGIVLICNLYAMVFAH